MRFEEFDAFRRRSGALGIDRPNQPAEQAEYQLRQCGSNVVHGCVNTFRCCYGAAGIGLGIY